uniref:Uncharacterized protein n=1 Tax=Tetranychus urticae TaxID=32264 RepID=T1L0T1_TETUR
MESAKGLLILEADLKSKNNASSVITVIALAISDE